MAVGLLLCAMQAHGGNAAGTVGDVGDEVIAHYTRLGDAEKLRAARFLVDNMRLHSFKDSPVLDKYYAGIEQVNKKYKYPACVEQYARLYGELGRPADVKQARDADAMTAGELIENIDMAFADWREGLWARHLTFDEFCEYLLPYRVGGEKVTPGWRKRLRDEYMKNARSILTSDDMAGQSYWAACKVNDALHSLRFRNSKVLPQLGVELPLQALDGMRMGECFDYATLAVYVMRACGIPVALDFTPQWPDRAHNHYWNALIDNTGLCIPFVGVESNPGYPSKQGRLLAKVYRRTFAYQPQSLCALNVDAHEDIPPVLASPFMRDVSGEYFKGRNLYVALNGAHKGDRFAYIAVFNNQEWVPVDFAVIDKDTAATFRNLGSDIVYLPVYWGRNGSLPAGDPVLVPLGGKAVALRPDHSRLQDVTLTRKYPHFYRIVKFRGLMKGGHFEAANKADFSDAVECAVIKKTPRVGYDTLSVSLPGGVKYRYWRFVAQDRGKCNTAEIKLISGGAALEPVEALGAGNGLDGTKPADAFDGDELTYYISDTPANGWVGADMGKPVSVDKIAYKPRNDDNDVTAGHTYELCYFENGRQRSAGVQRATGGSLTFSGVPSGALYVLHDLDKGTEERIFTYENGEVRWY